jgi:hypothetical protein
MRTVNHITSFAHASVIAVAKSMVVNVAAHGDRTHKRYLFVRANVKRWLGTAWQGWQLAAALITRCCERSLSVGRLPSMRSSLPCLPVMDSSLESIAPVFAG